MSKRPFSLFVLGTALVVSVATSQAMWEIDGSAEGAEVTLTPESPEAALQVDLQATDFPSDAWGQMYVTITVLEAVDAEAPATFDFALIAETERGDVTVDAIRGWSVVAATEENPTPERVALEATDVEPDTTWRVDVALTDGASARVDWFVEAWFESPEFDFEGEPRFVIALDPGR